MIDDSDRRGVAPPIKPRFAGTENKRSEQPVRLQRPRRRAPLPQGAVYVGRPTIWSNPFAGRNRIGHARSVILYQAWIDGDTSPHVLSRAGFSNAEAATLARLRLHVLDRIGGLAGHDLQCWCPLTSAWCHADVLIAAANSVAWRRAA